MERKKQDGLLLNKMMFTLVILVFYLLGKNLPLFMVDLSGYMQQNLGAEDIIMQAIRGDVYQCSLFALGISPYMISSIMIMVIFAFRSAEAKAKISPKKMNKLTMRMALVFSVIFAVIQVRELQFRATEIPVLLVHTVVVLEMITGSMLIIWLSSRNKRFGIGGQSALIFINIFDGIISSMKEYSIQVLLIPILLAFMTVCVMAIMENCEKRIPVQRISIHNIYADKNYLAIKMNPIGVMPAMFSMAVFTLPQLLVSALLLVFPANENIIWWQENLDLTKPVGIGVYVFILFLLTIGFSRVFINPDEITEQFLKSGDSIQDIHAGRDTKRYLSGVVTGLSIFSATIMGICLALPIILQSTGDMPAGLSALPTSFMMLTGLICNLSREVMAVRHLEAYKPFI